MSAAWYITAPGGGGTVVLSDAEIASLAVNFRIMATSTAQLSIHRDYDSVDAWWMEDTIVTIYRAASAESELVPFFTGRVLETPISADGGGEYRSLQLADGWQDLEDIVYQELWPIVGAGNVLIPKAVLGLDEAGDTISTGQQILAAVNYAISEGAAILLGTVADGVAVWPSEVANVSCANVILGEMRWNPDWAAWLDHSTVPPTFNAQPKSALGIHAIEIADEQVDSFDYSKLVRNIPRGVRILYEDAMTIDDRVYRNGYLDEAGATTGRKIMQTTIQLAGMNVQLQKSRIETRTMPTDAASMKAYFKLKWPELKDIPDGVFRFSDVSFELAPLGDQPPVICDKAPRVAVASVSDLPRELVRGQIEDWMRRKVGQVTVKYDLTIKSNAFPIEQKKILQNFSGEGKSFTVTATNATTKLYKGISSFTAGDGKPEGIAAAVYAAASAEQHEGQITLAAEDVSASVWLGRTVSLFDGLNELMPATVIHSVSMDIAAGTTTISFGPLPYLSAGDFLELQRMVNRRPVTWWSKEERASNEIGAEGAPGSKGDTVSGYDLPGIIAPPGGGPKKESPFEVTLGHDDPAYYVQVAHGKIVEREMTAGADVDALPAHECSNRMDGAAPRKFAIAVDQSIFVRVKETALGAIDAVEGIVLIVASTSATKSLNYIPGVQAGIYYYELAALVADGDEMKLVNEIAGSHIFHATGLTADLILRDCPTFEEGSSEPIPGAQLFRASFVSGKLASIGDSEEMRAYAPQKEETNVTYCT